MSFDRTKAYHGIFKTTVLCLQNAKTRTSKKCSIVLSFGRCSQRFFKRVVAAFFLFFILRPTKEYYCCFRNKSFVLSNAELRHHHCTRKRRIILFLTNKLHRDKPEQNIEQRTCPAFQASCYLSPSPKERK